MKTAKNIELRLHSIVLGPTLYTVLIDGAAWCNTADDNDGLNLQIALAKLAAIRNEEK